MTIGSHAIWRLVALVMDSPRSVFGDDLLLLLDERAALAEVTVQAVRYVVALDVVSFSDLSSFHPSKEPT